jgi:hypothetical protein
MELFSCIQSERCMLKKSSYLFSNAAQETGKKKKKTNYTFFGIICPFTIFEILSELKVKQCPYCSWLGEGGMQYFYRQEQETRCARRECFLLPFSMCRIYPWRGPIAQVLPMG